MSLNMLKRRSSGFRRQASCVVLCWCVGRCGRVLADWWWRLICCVVDHVEASLKRCVWYRVRAVFLPDRILSPSTVCGRLLM